MSWDASVLRGKSIQRARLFGMPHIGAHYDGETTQHYARDTDVCAICGCKAAHVHHEPPRQMGGGGYLELGGHIIRPALIALCPSCHSKRHDCKVVIDWEWNDPIFEEMWSSGFMLEDCEPHDPALYEFGCWAIYVNGNKVKEIRL